MKRLTAEEVAERFAKEPGGDVWRVAHMECASVVRTNLVPQWQDEPDESGWYFVESMEDEDPCYLYYDEEKWKFLYIDRNIHGNDDVFVDELADRRVCPIGARPKP